MNGKVAVKLPDGTPVVVEVWDHDYKIDDTGRFVMTPEEEQLELQIALAEGDAGLLIPAEQVIAELRAKTRAFLRAKTKAKTRAKPKARASVKSHTKRTRR